MPFLCCCCRRFRILTVQRLFYVFQDKNTLINNINNLQYNPGGFGQIDFAGALREARTNQFTTGRGKRLGAQDILIVLTNGESAVTATAVCMFSERKN